MSLQLLAVSCSVCHWLAARMGLCLPDEVTWLVDPSTNLQRRSSGGTLGSHRMSPGSTAARSQASRTFFTSKLMFQMAKKSGCTSCPDCCPKILTDYRATSTSWRGFFFSGGTILPLLDKNQLWEFEPLALPNTAIGAGYWLGRVNENGLPHIIMAPFSLSQTHTLKWIAPAEAILSLIPSPFSPTPNGSEFPLTMVQRWPVKIPIKGYRQKLRPDQLMQTGIRILDTLLPMLQGGTGFVPNPVR